MAKSVSVFLGQKREIFFMTQPAKSSRRSFRHTAAALPLLDVFGAVHSHAEIHKDTSWVFQINKFLVRAGEERHTSMNALLHRLSTQGTTFCKFSQSDFAGLIVADDVVGFKANAQRKCCDVRILACFTA